MIPAISRRQCTLSALLSGAGLASGDEATWRKICIALAEDAELRDPAETAECMPSAQASVLAALASHAS